MEKGAPGERAFADAFKVWHLDAGKRNFAALPDERPAPTVTSSLFTLKGNTEASRGYPADISLSVGTMDECQQRCLEAPTCKIFTYNRKTGICYRYSRAEFTPNADFESGERN
jgi:PAN domain